MRKISEVFINGVCLKEILEKHKKWLNEEDGGERADLSYADLRDADLSYTDLRNADLSSAILRGVDLSDSDLRGADLRGANLSNSDLRDAVLRRTNLRDAVLRNADLSYVNLKGADLSYANLNGADLRGADLSYTRLNCTDLSYANLRNSNLRNAGFKNANLRGADLGYTDLSDTYLRNANLSDANLGGANLSDADLRGANLNKVLYNHRTSFFAPVCPGEGSFIGYKRADNKIVKLLITEDSERSNATTRKCRCSKAKVLSITNIENTEEFSEVVSDFDKGFIYKVGEIVEVKDYDKDRWNECSTGRHFFITRDEAIIYQN